MTKKPPSKKPGHVKRRIRSIMKTQQGTKDQSHYPPRYIGRRTGLSFSRFLVEILVNNEELPPGQKITNEGIARLLISEFPQHKILHKNLKNGKRSVNYHRDLYNRGRYTAERPPPKLSYRYDEEGRALTARGAIMTPTQRAAYARKYLALHAVIKEHRTNPEETEDG